MQQVWLLSNSENLVAWIQVHNCAAAHWTASAAGACFPEFERPCFLFKRVAKSLHFQRGEGLLLVIKWPFHLQVGDKNTETTVGEKHL